MDVKAEYMRETHRIVVFMQLVSNAKRKKANICAVSDTILLVPYSVWGCMGAHNGLHGTYMI